MDALRRMLRSEPGEAGQEEPTLDLAALAMARIEFPDLLPGHWLAELDRHARQIERHMKDSGGAGFRWSAHQYLFEELGFQGDEGDYYNPLNSCLNHVLESRRGIPISLSVLYIELARRLGVIVNGIAAPGHFLVCLEEEGDLFYIDPFRGGTIREDIETEVDPSHRIAASRKAIATRMMNNLRVIYLQRQAWPKAKLVLDLLLEAEPDDGDALRQRAATNAGLSRYRAAALDLERYLALPGDVPDRTDLQDQVFRLHRMHAGRN